MTEEVTPQTPAQDTPKPAVEEKPSEGTVPKEEPKQPQPESTKEAPKEEKLELKLPDGSLLDQSALDGIAQLAKEQGLSPKQAQALVEKQAATLKAYSDKVVSDWTKQREAWSEAIKADKEIGGDQMPKSVELAKQVVSKFGSEDFRKALNETGFGNHPELVRIFARIGKMIGNDTLVRASTSPATSKKPLEEVFYGGTKQ